MRSVPPSTPWGAIATEAWMVFAPDGTVCAGHSESPLIPVQTLAWHRIARGDRIELCRAIQRDILDGGKLVAHANGWRVMRMVLAAKGVASR